MLSSHEKALEIQHQSPPPTHLSLAASYSNIGGVYESMGDYPRALLFYEKYMKIAQNSLPTAHLSLTASYSNISMVH